MDAAGKVARRVPGGRRAGRQVLDVDGRRAREARREPADVRLEPGVEPRDAELRPGRTRKPVDVADRPPGATAAPVDRLDPDADLAWGEVDVDRERPSAEP